jgi:hypothetical protein
MTRPDPLARLMTLAFHLNIAAALAMVLWTAWTGYLVATGEIRPAPLHATPAQPAVAQPATVSTPDCPCHRGELSVQARRPAEAA